ncbi:MAG: hypothetical protein R3C44_12810 [Chloroflexota bacterium]
MIFFHERPGRLFWIGLLLAIAGAAVILGVDALNDVGLGTFFGILSGMFYGGYFLVLQRSRQSLDTLTSFWLRRSAQQFSWRLWLNLHQP